LVSHRKDIGEISVCRNSFGKHEGKGSLGRHRFGKDNNNIKNLVGMGLEIFDWMHLTHDMDHWQAIVNTLMSLQFPLKNGKFLDFFPWS